MSKKTKEAAAPMGMKRPPKAPKGTMMRILRTRKTFLDLYLSMGTAMILGRFIAGVVKALILAPGTPVFAWVTTSLVEGIPGIVIQLALIPSIVYALMRARLLPQRYQTVAE